MRGFLSLDSVSRATVMAHASVVRPSVLILTQVSQKPLHESRPNFVESYLSAISPAPPFFFKIFYFQTFTIFFSFSLTWQPKFQNTTSPTVSVLFQPNFMISLSVTGEYSSITFLAICQKLKILWHLEMPKCYSSYIFYLMSDKLYEVIGYHVEYRLLLV